MKRNRKYFKDLVQSLRDFAEANIRSFEAEHIEMLNNAAESIEVLDDCVDVVINERDEAYERIDSLKEGFEGCCTTCEPVAIRNRALHVEQDRIKSLLFQIAEEANKLSE